MVLKIEITMDNAAFYTRDDRAARGTESARILRDLIGDIRDAGWADRKLGGVLFHKVLLDVNGNVVGQAYAE